MNWRELSNRDSRYASNFIDGCRVFPLFNFLYLFFGQFRRIALRPEANWQKMHSAFLLAILHIFFMCSSKQMFRVHAWRIVAGMTDLLAFRNCAVVQGIRKTVRVFSSLINIEYAISGGGTPAYPQPATSISRNFRDLRPKSIFCKHSWSHRPSQTTGMRTKPTGTMFCNGWFNPETLGTALADEVRSVAQIVLQPTMLRAKFSSLFNVARFTGEQFKAGKTKSMYHSILRSGFLRMWNCAATGTEKPGFEHDDQSHSSRRKNVAFPPYFATVWGLL